MSATAGLVRRTVLGRTHICRLDAQPLHGGFEWLRHYEHFWNQRLDRLEALLRAEDASPAAAATPPVSGARPRASKRKPRA